MAFEYLLKVFKKNQLFREVNSQTLVELIKKLHVKRIDKGIKVIKEGEHGDMFYIIHTGSVVVKKKTGIIFSKILAHLINDDCFGEMALISDQPRSATVITEEYSEFFTLNRDAFKNIIMKDPTLRRNIEEIAAKRKIELAKL